MRKKHFAGVLMLTAAVALGTVTPAVLPSTVVVVKAQSNNYSVQSDDNLKNAEISPAGHYTVRIHKKGLKNLLKEGYVYAIGSEKQATINSAVASKKTIVCTDDDTAYITTEGTNDSFIVVVKSDSATKQNPYNVNGIVYEPTRTNQNAPNTPDDVDDDVQATGAAEQEYALKEDSKKDDELTWKDVDESSHKFPVEADVVVAGEEKTYLLRNKAKGKEFASNTKQVKIKKRKPLEFSELNQLTYTIKEDKKLKFSGLKDKFLKASVVTRSGVFAYTIVKKDEEINSKVKENAGTDLTAENQETAVLADGDRVVIYVKGTTESLPAKKLTLTVKQAVKPELEKVDGKYQIKITNYDANAKVTYMVKGTSGDFDPATLVDIADNKKAIKVSGADTYTVKAVSTENEEKGNINFNNNEATYTLDSNPSDGLKIDKIDTEMDKEKFEKIKFAVDDGKLTITGLDTEEMGKIAAKIQYTNGGAPVELKKGKDTKNDPIILKAGEFKLFVEGHEEFTRIIKVTEPKYEKAGYADAKSFLSDFGKADYEIKNKADKAEVKYKAGDTLKAEELKAGTYLVKYKNPSKMDNVDFNKEVEVKIATPVEVTLGKKSSPSTSGSYSPVVPSTTPSKTNEKKDTTKKPKETKKPEETKKPNETKKPDTTKPADTKKPDTTPSKTEDRPAPKAKAITVKSGKAEVKVSEEKVDEALERGLKVKSKSGEIKLTKGAAEKIFEDGAEAVTISLKTVAAKTTSKEITKNLKGSKLVTKKVFTLDVKSGNTSVKLNGAKVEVALKVSKKDFAGKKTVWVMDLKTGKRVKATYKNGKVMFKAGKLGKFVIVNKAK